MKKLIIISAFLITNIAFSAPSAEAEKIITLLGVDRVFSAHGPFPEDMERDMKTKGLSQDTIMAELAEALEKDFTTTEIKEFAAFLEGPIWTKFRESDKSLNKDSNTEFSRTLAKISQRWNEYMSDKTLPERKNEK